MTTLKLTWLANAPWTATGYGQQTALFTTRLTAKGHEIAVIANYGHSGFPMKWNGIQVFGNSFHPYAMDVISGHSKSFGADALISVMDTQVFEPPALLGVKWIAWMPIDHQNAPPNVLGNCKEADFRITMSKHAQEELKKHNIEADYIPCGVDTSVYKPLDRAKCREEMGLPLDRFIIGMVAMNKGNPSRKAFNQTIAAFAALQKKHKDCLLYLHTMDGLRGYEVVNLLEVCKALDLTWGYGFADMKDKDVIFANQYGLSIGYEPAMMAKLFNCFDVYSGVTRGEGFGIPILEAQACGVPAIIGDWTSMPEIHFSGWKVLKEESEPIFTPMGAWQFEPSAAVIADRMDAAYRMRGNTDYQERARKGALAYDADKIVDNYWMPTLFRIQAELNGKPKSAALERNMGVLR